MDTASRLVMMTKPSFERGSLNKVSEYMRSRQSLLQMLVMARYGHIAKVSCKRWNLSFKWQVTCDFTLYLLYHQLYNRMGIYMPPKENNSYSSMLQQVINIHCNLNITQLFQSPHSLCKYIKVNKAANLVAKVLK